MQTGGQSTRFTSQCRRVASLPALQVSADGWPVYPLCKSVQTGGQSTRFTSQCRRVASLPVLQVSVDGWPAYPLYKSVQTGGRSTRFTSQCRRVASLPAYPCWWLRLAMTARAVVSHRRQSATDSVVILSLKRVKATKTCYRKGSRRYSMDVCLTETEQ